MDPGGSSRTDPTVSMRDAGERRNSSVRDEEKAEVPVPPFLLHECQDIRNAAQDGRMDGSHV